MLAQTIQLALAPVFVLVAIGNIMNLLSARLGRVVDRSRALQAAHRQTSGPDHDLVVREIRIVHRRITLIGSAIWRMVLSGLCTGLTVALLFVEEFAGWRLQPVVALSFILAVGLLMWALVLFLMETRAASEALRIPADYLELDREL